jgi:hypothetical protein
MDTENKGNVSDGYHTFNDLYAHRRELFFALCRLIKSTHYVWKSKLHAKSDNDILEDVFIIGINTESGSQISYHVHLAYWEEADFAQTLSRAPKWDGHTPDDVLKRLATLS